MQFGLCRSTLGAIIASASAESDPVSLALINRVTSLNANVRFQNAGSKAEIPRLSCNVAE